MLEQPPWAMDDRERELNRDEIARLGVIYDHVQKVLAGMCDGLGFSVAKEQVSLGDEFGYVFRYEITQLIEDVEIPPWIDQSDRVRYAAQYCKPCISTHHVMIWTAKGEKFAIATGPKGGSLSHLTPKDPG